MTAIIPGSAAQAPVPPLAAPVAPKPSREFLWNTVYSQTAAIATLTLTNVFDVVKVRQIEDIANCSTEHFRLKTLTGTLLRRLAPAGAGLNQTFAGCTDCLPQRNFLLTIVHLARTEGVARTFLTGIDKNIYMQAIRAGMFFPFFELFRKRLAFLDGMFRRGSDANPKNERLVSTVCGSFLARSITSFVAFPLELLKIRRQAQGDITRPVAIRELAREVVREPRKYTRIFWLYFQREVYFTLIFWSVMEQIEERLGPKDTPHPSLAFTAKSAGFSGALAALVTYPFDMVATNNIISSDRFDSRSTKQTVRYFVQNFGWRYFLNGLSLRVLRSSVNSMIFVSTYKYFKRHEDSNVLK